MVLDTQKEEKTTLLECGNGEWGLSLIQSKQF